MMYSFVPEGTTGCLPQPSSSSGGGGGDDGVIVDGYRWWWWWWQMMLLFLPVWLGPHLSLSVSLNTNAVVVRFFIIEEAEATTEAFFSLSLLLLSLLLFPRSESKASCFCHVWVVVIVSNSGQGTDSRRRRTVSVFWGVVDVVLTLPSLSLRNAVSSLPLAWETSVMSLFDFFYARWRKEPSMMLKVIVTIGELALWLTTSLWGARWCASVTHIPFPLPPRLAHPPILCIAAAFVPRPPTPRRPFKHSILEFSLPPFSFLCVT